MVRLYDCHDMTLDVYRGRETTTHNQDSSNEGHNKCFCGEMMKLSQNCLQIPAIIGTLISIYAIS